MPRARPRRDGDRPPDGTRRLNHVSAPRLVEHLFRHEHGRIVATLARALGHTHLDLAEEAVQEACLRALRSWPFDGIPRDPSAWLFRTARNHALDILRRSRRWDELALELEARLERLPTDGLGSGTVDDSLALICACCHPRLAPSSRVALTLKAACGFSTGEIAHAFLVPEHTIAQRIVRAKHTLQTGVRNLQVPSHEELDDRVNTVLDVLYLLFNEGYASHGALDPIRVDLTEEALRLTRLLAAHPAGNRSSTHALLALLLFQSSRLPARLDQGGAMVPIAEQDRSVWDRSRIEEGLIELARAAQGQTLTEYHLHAEIAAVHATAPSASLTDWERIVAAYDELLRRNDSAVLRLNRAIAIGELEGADAGLREIDVLQSLSPLSRYSFLPAARAHFLTKLGRADEARAEYTRATDLAENEADRAYLQKRSQ